MSIDNDTNREMLIKKFIALGVLGALVVFGWGFYEKNQSKEMSRLANKLYDFEQSVVSEYETGKTNGVDLVERFSGLIDQSSTPIVALSLGIKLNDMLIKKQDFASSKALLMKLEGISKDQIARQVILPRLAVVLEELGENTRAVEYLEKNLTLKNTLLQDKTYFDLGRLYLKVGDKEKAKSSMDYVIEKSKNKDLVKLAKFFLGKI